MANNKSDPQLPKKINDIKPKRQEKSKAKVNLANRGSQLNRGEYYPQINIKQPSSGKIHVAMVWKPIYVAQNHEVNVHIKTESREIMGETQYERDRPYCAFRTHQYELIFLNNAQDDEDIINGSPVQSGPLRNDLTFHEVEVKLFECNTNYDKLIKIAELEDDPVQVPVVWTEKKILNDGENGEPFYQEVINIKKERSNSKLSVFVDWLDTKKLANRPTFNSWYHFRLIFSDRNKANILTLASNPFRVVSKPSVWIKNTNKLAPRNYKIPIVEPIGQMHNLGTVARRRRNVPRVDSSSMSPVLNNERNNDQEIILMRAEIAEMRASIDRLVLSLSFDSL